MSGYNDLRFTEEVRSTENNEEKFKETAEFHNPIFTL